MATILIAYASGLGQTALVAVRIARSLEASGHAVVLADVAAVAQPRPVIKGFDAVLIGAPVRMGKHHRAVIDFCREHAVALRARPSGFFSVSLSAGSQKPGGQREVAKAIAHFVKATGWAPTRVEPIAGALAYTKYGFWLRPVMRLIARMAGHSTDASRDHEYTDWAQVERFAQRFAASLPRPSHRAGEPGAAGGVQVLVEDRDHVADEHAA